MKRRILACVAAICGAGLVLSGCSAGGASDDSGSANGKITLSFPSFQYKEPGTSTFWKAAIKKYESKHPNVTIDFKDVSGGDWNDVLTTRFAANNPPDIVHIASREFQRYASKGWFHNLNKCLADTNVLDKWTPLQKEMVWKGQTQSMLLLTYAYHLYYNKAMLQAAGINKPPETPEEFVNAAKAVNALGNKKVGFAAITTSDRELFPGASMFVTGMGGSWTKDGKYTLTSTKTIKALDVWRKMFAPAPKGMNEHQRNELFLNGQAAMMMDGNYFWAYVQDSATAEVKKNAGIGLLPFSIIPGAVSNGLSIPASLTGAKFDAACDFLKLVASPKMQRLYSEDVNVPAPGPDSVSPEMIKKSPELKLMADAASKAVSIYPSDVMTDYSKFAKIVIEGLVKLIDTSDDTTAVMKQVQSELESEVPLN